MKIILALLVFSVLVLFHEFGHFLLAKKNGIGVTEFSFGMGPRIASFVKGGTRYSWKLIPFGGSCAMVGEDMEEEGENAFNSKSVWARISVVAAGPVFNFILAFVLAIIVIGMQGYDECTVISIGNTESFMGAYFYSDDTECEVLAIVQDSIAHKAGLEGGDIIIGMDEQMIASGLDLRNALTEDVLKKEKIDFTIQRDGEKKTITFETNDEYKQFTFHAVKESAAAKAGLKRGDIIREYDGENIVIGRDLWLYQYMNDTTEKSIDITYERDGKEYKTTLNPSEKYFLGISYMATDDACKLEDVTKGGPSEKAGLKKGDIIIKLGDESVNSGKELKNIMDSYPLDESVVVITVKRGNEEIQVDITPSKSYTVGFNFSTGYSVKGTPLQVLRYSFTELRYNMESTVKSLYMLCVGKVSTNDVSGPVGIVNIVGDAYEQSKPEGYRVVFMNISYLVILLSVNLGVLNLLPFPALDGGRLVFLFIEAIRRKPVPREKEAIVHFIGMVILMGLMVLILFNDISKLF